MPQPLSPYNAPTIVLDETDELARLSLNTSVYSEAVIFRTAYTFTGRCAVILDRIDTDHLLVELRKREPASSLRGITADFANELINERLREIVANETRLIRELIVSQAFAEADLRSPRD